MALLFLDSCDLYATREQIARRWEPNATSISYLNVIANAGRWGGRAIQLASSGTGRIIRPIPPRQTVILAFAARFTRTDNPVNQAFIARYDPTYTQVVIAVDFLEGRYRCYRGWFDTEFAQIAVDFAAEASCPQGQSWPSTWPSSSPWGASVPIRRARSPATSNVSASSTVPTPSMVSRWPRGARTPNAGKVLLEDVANAAAADAVDAGERTDAGPGSAGNQLHGALVVDVGDGGQALRGIGVDVDAIRQGGARHQDQRPAHPQTPKHSSLPPACSHACGSRRADAT